MLHEIIVLVILFIHVVGLVSYILDYTLSNFSGCVEDEVKPAESYICQYCDREFKHSDNLVRHEMQHLIGNSYEVRKLTITFTPLQ